jgi:hypothetical protein
MNLLEEMERDFRRAQIVRRLIVVVLIVGGSASLSFAIGNMAAIGVGLLVFAVACVCWWKD